MKVYLTALAPYFLIAVIWQLQSLLLSEGKPSQFFDSVIDRATNAISKLSK